MITKGRVLLIINECAAVLLTLSVFILEASENGMSYVMQYNAGYYVVQILLCLLLPFGIIKAGWPLSEISTVSGTVVVSFKATQLLYFIFERVLETSSALNGNGGLNLTTVAVALSVPFICNFLVSIRGAEDWFSERHAALSESKLREIEKNSNVIVKIIVGLVITAAVLVTCWALFINYQIARIRGTGAWGFVVLTIDTILYGIERGLLVCIVLFFCTRTGRHSKRPSPQEDPREKTAKSVESCIKKETIQDDMEALTLLERSRSDPREQGFDDTSAFYISISQVQYMLGDFDKARKSIQEGMDFDDQMVRMKGGETDEALLLKAKLYDAGGRISGVLKEYGTKLDECKSMLGALKRLSNADTHRSETARAYTEMADALHGLGQYEEALGACDQAVVELKQLASQKTTVARRSYARLNTVKAKILLDTGKIEEAGECASKAIELYSGMSESYECAIGAAHLVMARIQSERGNCERAEKEYLIAESLVRDRYGTNHPIYREVSQYATC